MGYMVRSNFFGKELDFILFSTLILYIIIFLKVFLNLSTL
jgi:hypothetical protein